MKTEYAISESALARLEDGVYDGHSAIYHLARAIPPGAYPRVSPACANLFGYFVPFDPADWPGNGDAIPCRHCVIERAIRGQEAITQERLAAGVLP